MIELLDISASSLFLLNLTREIAVHVRGVITTRDPRRNISPRYLAHGWVNLRSYATALQTNLDRPLIK